MRGTIWIDEGDRQVAHLEVTFDDNFHVAGGLLASVQKGSNFRFDQVSSPIPTTKTHRRVPRERRAVAADRRGEGTMQARILMVKNLRQHFMERDSFSVDTQQQKDAKVVSQK